MSKGDAFCIGLGSLLLFIVGFIEGRWVIEGKPVLIDAFRLRDEVGLKNCGWGLAMEGNWGFRISEPLFLKLTSLSTRCLGLSFCLLINKS